MAIDEGRGRAQGAEGLETYERKIDAIEAVLRRKLPALPYLTDEWIRELAEACYAAADTGI